MSKKSLLALAILSSLAASNASASNKIADARGNAMGNTGVASADYLTAPFYNPALAANYRDHDDFGVFIGIDVAASDKDDAISELDDLQDNIDELNDSGSNDTTAIDANLTELDGSQPVQVSAGTGIAIALPTKLVSSNLFVRGYAEIIAQTDVTNDYETSNVDFVAFGYVEAGLALAQQYTIAGQEFSFGITPKYQQMRTYAQIATVENFDLDDYDESETSESAFNFDLGAVWYLDNFRTAIAVKDLIAQEIDVIDTSGAINGSYHLDTQVTLGVAYSSDYFVAAIDADLTKQKRFEGIGTDDDTQFVRLGLEGNAWGWAQLRAGYEIDLEETLDNSITAGIGFSPFDLVSLDIAGSYAGENQVGVSANLALTF
ncbi:conjugal transfer protein TraF [Psychromonas sp. 14N.309.X.WAT.B.A12]|uniref:conjugal transfer protein TraF n=1 Tax=unclassified Psychromonas TaxID=2614957 RepID=UPI0025B0F9C9|nr:conjugal transfer protein TraF [Psychromonas sp. 14N.309.X.WAT.B.A12]MDN2662085.1 conjugal transfer protein TraF [Psychromonas sp. 14N.309.X.WAT.B.A12]